MFRILHLSDLHARESATWSTTPILLQAKQEILRQSEKENIDLVVFTGDLAYSGKKAEYDIAYAWLDNMCLSSSGLNIQKQQILLVPGNHDVDRSQISHGATAIETALQKATTQATVAQFYNGSDEKAILLRRHQAFFEFHSSLRGMTDKPSNCWSNTFQNKTGGRVRVDGLNTSWLCRGDDDQGRLLVGQPQLTELINAHELAGTPDVRITMMHHPLSDLMRFDEENTVDYLKQHTDIVLRGHLHSAGASTYNTNTGSYIEIAAGALHESHEAPKHFNIIDITDDLGAIYITPFIYVHGRWIHDRNLFSTNDGVGYVSIDKRDTNRPRSVAVQSVAVSVSLREATGGDRRRGETETPSSGTRSIELPRFQHTPSAQDKSIRLRQLEEAVVRLKGERYLVIQKESGAKYTGFLGCIVEELNRQVGHEISNVFHISCVGIETGKQFQDAIELVADQSLTVLGNSLRESGRSILILDDLDFPIECQPHRPQSIEGTIEALTDFCPDLIVIRVSALPCPAGTRPILVGRLDEADTRTYLSTAPQRVNLSSIVDYSRVFRATGGLPVYLDEFVSALDVTNIDEALLQADAHPHLADTSLHERIVNEVQLLRESTSDDLRRSRLLLWTLAILVQGETLGAIKRLDDTSPIWPKNATHLQSRGCLECVSLTNRISGLRLISNEETDKILRLPRLVRDYVLTIMTNQERVEIVKRVANLYFSDDWRKGVVRMRRRLSIGANISTHQSGNELAILKILLTHPDVYFTQEPLSAYHLALSYVTQLNAKGFYGEAYEAAKDTLAIVRRNPAFFPEESIVHIQLAAARCARMVGDREACVDYLQTAIPIVRASCIKSALAEALVVLAMALQSLNQKAEALAAVEEILQIADKNGSEYYQACAIKTELTMTRDKAVAFLKTHAVKARRRGHFTVADNALLEVASDCNNVDEKIKMMNTIRSRRDLSYNFVRATLKRIDTLIDDGRVTEISGADRDDLWFCYSFAYSQRIAALFDSCNRVCWKYLETRNENQHLGELYMYSSFVWRLRGNSHEEMTYSLKLKNEASRSPSPGFAEFTIGYILRRLSALGLSVGST